MSANTIFIKGQLLKDRTGVSDAIDDKQLKPQIKLAQDMYLQPALGSTLYLRLQSGVEANNLNTNETTLLNNYVTDCLVWYTMSLLPIALGFQFFSKGVLQKTSDESNTPSRSDLEVISSQYKQTAEFYKQRLINYLRQNYSLFAEYINTGGGRDVIFPEAKAYTCPIFLGVAPVEEAGRAFINDSSSGTPVSIEISPATGVASFTITGLPGNATIILAIRSGVPKGITNAATANTLYLQINGSTCTLPTGDVTGSGELFIFMYR